MRPRQTRRRSVHGRLAEYSWIGCAAVLCFAIAALAAPPPNADPQLAPWFKELSRAWRPGSGATVKCCDIADCRVTDYREIADHYEVLIDERFPGVLAPSWHRVAPEAVLSAARGGVTAGRVPRPKLASLLPRASTSGGVRPDRRSRHSPH
jgi:hypothetical protein